MMKITDLLTKNAIKLNVKAKDKEDAINKAVGLMEKQGVISDREKYVNAIWKREKEGTTGVGQGIAIPHGRCDAVSKPALIALTIPDGVEFEALDGEPVKLLFLIAASMDKSSEHIDILSKLSAMLMNENFTSDLLKAKSREEFIKVIDQEENKKDTSSNKNDENTANHKINILAVTACPTGIAHTYMAAENLEKAAQEKNCNIKVETRGSGGTKNAITDDEIQKADFVIIAADTNVPLDRFDGIKLIETSVSEGISKADKLIEKAIAGDAKPYKAKDGAGLSSKNTAGKAGHSVYKHLMNGVSHMLPFVVGGGILIAIAFLIDGLNVDLNNIPDYLIQQFGSADDVKANFGTLMPTSAFLKGIGGLAFSLMLPILAGFIAMSIADRPGLVVGIVGGLISSTGKSGFLGALAAGFIAGYIIKLLMLVFSKLPKSLEGIKPILLYPVFGVLLIGIIMTFIIEPFVGIINTSLNEALNSMTGVSSIILGLILGGMMAIDMGGPFNKAAYVFGTASIAYEHYNIMAAVMIGGMIPPCAIALSTLLFKNKYTLEERKSGPTNFIMGLAFITEGAIPFAAADPLRVIPACIIGSALGGALSMAFNCTLMAPHGGIFVFPVVGNPLMYCVALVAGTVFSALLLGLFKKKV